jgi:hypothetical protein
VSIAQGIVIEDAHGAERGGSLQCAVPNTRPRPEQYATRAESQPIQGDTHTHLLPALGDRRAAPGAEEHGDAEGGYERLAGELGYSVARRPLDGPADGWCDSQEHVGYSDYGRRRAEVLVDAVTFIVCGAVGQDTSGSSVPYVAGRG